MTDRTKARWIGVLPFLLAALSIAFGCSRIERVKIINNYPIPVRILLSGKETEPIIPAHSERMLEGRHYIGGTVRVTVFNIAGKRLREVVVDPPGDSAVRTIALIVVDP